jgi:hypothetical protein
LRTSVNRPNVCGFAGLAAVSGESATVKGLAIEGLAPFRA